MFLSCVVEHASAKLASLYRKGNVVRDDVAESVARGAQEVERFATAAKSDAARVRGMEGVTRKIPRADVRWLARRLSGLSGRKRIAALAAL